MEAGGIAPQAAAEPGAVGQRIGDMTSSIRMRARLKLLHESTKQNELKVVAVCCAAILYTLLPRRPAAQAKVGNCCCNTTA